MRFSYHLRRHGWAEVVLQDADQLVAMSVSYITDALRDLLDAVWSLAQGRDEAAVDLWEEPGRYRWQFSRTATGVRVEISAFGNGPEGDRAVFAASTSLDDLVREVVREATAVLTDEGVDGYRTKWQAHPFPTNSLERLAACEEHIPGPARLRDIRGHARLVESTPGSSTQRSPGRRFIA